MEETPVFTETNLGTRLAVPISPHATATDFNRAFERAHLVCFPEHGEIKVNALMVQRKSFAYHLPGTLPLKHAFQSSKGNWFLQVKVCHPSIRDQLASTEHIHEKIKDSSTEGNGGAGSTEPENIPTNTTKVSSKCRRRRIKRLISRRIPLLDIRKRFYLLPRQKKKNKSVKKKYGIKCSKNVDHIAYAESCGDKPSKEGNSGLEVDSHNDTSESMSVSGIIEKYFSCYDFSGYDEENSISGFAHSTVRTDNCHMNFGVCTTPQSIAKTPPQNVRQTNESTSMASSTVKKAEVGKRLLTAANNLGFNGNNQSPGLSLVRSLVYA